MRWAGLWRRGAGTLDDPDDGRLIFRLTGIGAYLYCRRFDNQTAKWRGLYWWIVRRYCCEFCQHCGRPVDIVYHAPDWIWEAVTGQARHPDGHAAPGILCPRCLDDLAEAKGLPYLRWTCATSDEGMAGKIAEMTKGVGGSWQTRARREAARDELTARARRLEAAEDALDWIEAEPEDVALVQQRARDALAVLRGGRDTEEVDPWSSEQPAEWKDGEAPQRLPRSDTEKQP